MRDIFIVGFLLFMVAAACRRPFLMTMTYLYVDLTQPQRISYYLLNSVPISMIMAIAAAVFFVLFDDKRNLRFGRIQFFMTLLLIWITVTTIIAQLPSFAWIKWDWVWKAIAFGIFLPFVLSTRQRIEAALFFIVFCVATITIPGAVKTILGGGGYGTVRFLVDINSGLYEGSTASTVAVAVIPLILYLYKNNTLFPKSWLTKLVATGLIVCSLLVPIGTEARTGLVCIGVLALITFLHSKRKLLITGGMVIATLMALPLLPQSFTDRMATIADPNSESSASTRLAVWQWTLDFVGDHPLGGGFDAYRLNQVDVVVTQRSGDARNSSESTVVISQDRRAFHSAYFEVLGEHGYPGLAIFLSMVGLGLVQLRRIASKYPRNATEHEWTGNLARSMLETLLIYLTGAAFIGIAFQTPLYFFLAISASLAHVVAAREGAAKVVARRPRLQGAMAH